MPEIAELTVSAAAATVKKQIAHKTANTLQHPLFILFAPYLETIQALICDTDTSVTNVRQMVAVLSRLLKKYSLEQGPDSDLKAFMVKLEEKGQELDLRSQAHRAVSFFHERHSLNQAKSRDGSSTVGQFQKHAENSNCFQAEKTKQSIDAKKLRIKNKDRLEQYQRPEAAV